MTVFLDKFSELKIFEKGDLPHMHQDGKMQYVTFRLADSLPKAKIDELISLRNEFIRCNPLPRSAEKEARFRKLFNDKVQKYLDAGYGSCVLQEKANRKLLVEEFSSKNNTDYLIDAYVIMPNHVHMLITTFHDLKITDILGHIKGKSAYKINKHLNRRGTLWEREIFDRIVRDDDHLKHCLTYIINNPKNLPPDSYAIYVRNGL